MTSDELELLSMLAKVYPIAQAAKSLIDQGSRPTTVLLRALSASLQLHDGLQKSRLEALQESMI